MFLDKLLVHRAGIRIVADNRVPSNGISHSLDDAPRLESGQPLRYLRAMVVGFLFVGAVFTAGALACVSSGRGALTEKE